MREENIIKAASCLIPSIIGLVVIGLIVGAIILGVKTCNNIQRQGLKNIIEKTWEGEDGNKNKD